jgi:hypothetical protein
MNARKGNRVPSEDGFAAELAIEHKTTLVTRDSDFRKLGHGFDVVWLKASREHLPCSKSSPEYVANTRLSAGTLEGFAESK